MRVLAKKVVGAALSVFVILIFFDIRMRQEDGVGPLLFLETRGVRPDTLAGEVQTTEPWVKKLGPDESPFYESDPDIRFAVVRLASGEEVKLPYGRSAPLHEGETVGVLVVRGRLTRRIVARRMMW